MTLIRFLKDVRIKLMHGARSLREHAGYVKRRFVTPSLPNNPEGGVYVNLGCGVNTSKEFINIDTRPMPHTHFVHEVEHLPMLQDNSVDLVYASHLLEHISRDKIHAALREWYRVLKPGGVLRFGVPDFDGLVKVYESSDRNVDSIVNQLMGGDGQYDDHHSIWNFAYATKMLTNAGFKEVREWDYKKVEHHDFIDKTMRSVQMNGKGISISLNVEAVK